MEGLSPTHPGVQELPVLDGRHAWKFRLIIGGTGSAAAQRLSSCGELGNTLGVAGPLTVAAPLVAV